MRGSESGSGPIRVAARSRTGNSIDGRMPSPRSKTRILALHRGREGRAGRDSSAAALHDVRGPRGSFRRRDGRARGQLAQPGAIVDEVNLTHRRPRRPGLHPGHRSCTETLAYHAACAAHVPRPGTTTRREGAPCDGPAFHQRPRVLLIVGYRIGAAATLSSALMRAIERRNETAPC